MTDLKNEYLVESLAAALEIMAFVTLTPPEDDARSAPPVGAVLVTVEFSGKRNGQFELIAPRDLGLLLLANTLSCDPSDTLVMPNPGDALIELANIACGMFLKRSGSGPKPEMHVPKLRPYNVDAHWHELIGAGEHDILIADGSTIAVRVIEE